MMQSTTIQMFYGVSFEVHGIPKPGGSKRGFFNKYTKRVQIVDACKNGDWKADVKRAAMEAYAGPLLDELIDVDMTFFLLRPKGHFNSKGQVKPNAPEAPGTKPDVLKLARSTEDALTGIVWIDDSRTVTLTLRKRYGPKPGAIIRIVPHERDINGVLRSDPADDVLPSIST